MRRNNGPSARRYAGLDARYTCRLLVHCRRGIIVNQTALLEFGSIDKFCTCANRTYGMPTNGVRVSSRSRNGKGHNCI
jgi:hypothetical protein